MIKKINAYSRRYEFEFGNGVYDKIANNSYFGEICGKAGDSLLVRGSQDNLFLIERNHKTNKEIIKIHSKELDEIQSKLEKITGVDFSQYRVDFSKYRIH